MSAMAPQNMRVSIVCSAVCSGADQRKHQSFASLAFVKVIHRWPVDSPHKGPVTRIIFPFDDVIIIFQTKLHDHFIIARCFGGCHTDSQERIQCNDNETGQRDNTSIKWSGHCKMLLFNSFSSFLYLTFLTYSPAVEGSDESVRFHSHLIIHSCHLNSSEDVLSADFSYSRPIFK